MITLLLHLLRLLPFLCGGHRQLAIENLALRQQLASLRLTPHRFHADWNYTIHPARRR